MPKSKLPRQCEYQQSKGCLALFATRQPWLSSQLATFSSRKALEA
jgi:hypothetical protein